MPKNSDLKRLVRARMAKTGESYTAARAQLLDKKGDARVRTPVAQYAELAGMSDEAVHAKTGRTWREWVALLDAADANRWEHREIAKWLRTEHDVAAWWSQTVTVAYERIRGLRAVGQRRGGGFDVNKSKTYPVPVATLYAAFGARMRRRWLPDVEVRIRTSTRDKSMRLRWPDDTAVNVHFWSKGAAKSQVQLQHKDQPDKAAAEKMRAFWTERLAALGEVLG